MAKAPEELLGIKKPATEETLQSIDSTLKRILELLEKKEKREQALYRPLDLRYQQTTDIGDKNERDINSAVHYSN